MTRKHVHLFLFCCRSFHFLGKEKALKEQSPQTVGFAILPKHIGAVHVLFTVRHRFDHMSCFVHFLLVPFRPKKGHFVFRDVCHWDSLNVHVVFW